ncbi:YbhB/YbcL family Raf kinase inhibitor-like protein [Prosthecobacter sp.]|uniref:YbhB/YbcL family Raf kinase inhibitor-like protein n=1 Tax=Prosthecobacter sp. TaxID=1965333 RepID=UPI0037831976
MIDVRRILILAVLLLIAAATGVSLKPSLSSMSTTPQILTLRCPAFAHGTGIPARYTGDGANVSPELDWSDAPQGTRSFALICDDPDAPHGTWVHWLLWNLPGGTASLPEAVEKKRALPAGTQTGRNDSGGTSYDGPAPPPGGAHRYFFKLYALDSTLTLAPGSRKSALEKAMAGHVLAQGVWMGTYQHQ